MSPTTPPKGVLRNVPLQALPKTLARPVRERQAPTPAAPVLHALPTRLAAARPAGPEAESGALQVRERARAEGFEAGLKEGRAEAQRRLEEAIQAAQATAHAEAQAMLRKEAERLTQQWQERAARLEALPDAVSAAVREHLDHLEREAVGLAFEALCRLLGAQAGRRETLEALVAQALSQVRTRPLRIRLDPADLALLADAGATSRRSAHPELQWIADPAVGAAGCVIEAEAGDLDASLRTQLDRLLRGWQEALGDAPDGAAKGASR